MMGKTSPGHDTVCKLTVQLHLKMGTMYKEFCNYKKVSAALFE